MALVTESWRGSWSLPLWLCINHPSTRSLEVNINQSIKRGPKWPTATHARGFRWCRSTKGVVSRSTAESDPNGQSGSEVNLFPICHASAFIAGWAVPSFIWYLANWQRVTWKPYCLHHIAWPVTTQKQGRPGCNSYDSFIIAWWVNLSANLFETVAS